MTVVHTSVMSPEVAVASAEPAQRQNPGPTQTQRACLRLPCGALSDRILNTECPPVPSLHPARSVWKCGMGGNAHRGLESLSLRISSIR
jgi:hypothetical protein